MVFGAYETLGEQDLLVIPVGVNYTQPDKFQSDLFYNVGEPISIREFLKDKNESPAKIQNAFLQFLEPKLRDLITHIDDPSNDTMVLQAEEVFKKELIREKKLNPSDLSDDFFVLKEITHTLNQASKEQPALLEEFKSKLGVYFQNLRANNIRDWLLRPSSKYLLNYPFVFFRTLLLLLSLPVFVLGFCVNLLPNRITFYITNKLVKSREFYSSFVIAFALPVFLIYYLILFGCVNHFLQAPWLSLLLMVISMLSGWFCYFYLRFAVKTSGIFRTIVNKTRFKELKDQREELKKLFNKF